MRPDFKNPLHVILAQRLWQAGSGMVTIVMITNFLSPAQQGWYFSLISFVAMYTLFDMGLSFVLVQAAAHTFVGLRWGRQGRIEGVDRRRFEALIAWSARHYFWLTFFFALVITPAGISFFSTTSPNGISWLLPWLVLAITSAIVLLMLPFMALLEGSGEVLEVYRVRLVQGVVAGLALWVAFLSGLGLWAVVMTPIAGIVVQGIWLARHKPALMASAVHGPHGDIHWRSEIWPHQWQLGLGWISGYMLTQIYTPVLFKLQDAVIAGQMGLTMTVSNMLGLLALSWVTRHVPAMSKAVATRDRSRFYALCRQDLLLSCAAFLAGLCALCALHWIIGGTRYAERILPFWPFLGVLVSGFIGHIQSVLSAQLRSFRKEPLVWVSLVGAILMAGGAIWGAMHYSAAGVVLALLSVQSMIILPASIAIWRNTMRKWDVLLSEPAADQLDSTIQMGIQSHLDA